MSRQYIGARYVPVFADPLAWDITKNYDALTIVQNNNDTYTSKKAVPSGTPITNTEYWVKTGNYNAQLQEYIEVASEAADKADEAEEKADEAIAGVTEINENTIAFYFKPSSAQPVYIDEMQASSPTTVIPLPHPITIDDKTVVKVSVFTRGTSMYHPQATPHNKTNVGRIRFITENDTNLGLSVGEVQSSCLYQAEELLYANNGEFITTKIGTEWVCSGSTTGFIVNSEGARETGMIPYASRYAGADAGSMTFTSIGLRYDRNDATLDGAKTCGIYVILEKQTLANN